MFAFKLELISATLCGPQNLNPHPKTQLQLEPEPELKAEEP